MKEVVLIGYSGHAHVVYDILKGMGRTIIGYCDLHKKEDNHDGIIYFGNENDEDVLNKLKEYDCFVSIGNNQIRGVVSKYLTENGINLINAIHPSAIVSDFSSLGFGVMIGPNSVINARSNIGNGVICNSGSIVEHDTHIGEYCHVAPGAILCGGVRLGNFTLIGSGAAVAPNVSIGLDVIVGIGTVVIQNINDNLKVVGNPQRYIHE